MTASLSSCTFVKVNHSLFDGLDAVGARIKGNKEFATVSYTVPQFEKVDIFLPAEVVYEMTEGDPSVEIYTSSNLIDYLHFTVEDGCLNVRADNNERLVCEEMKITLKSRTLNDIRMRGAGDMELPSGIECEALSITVQGAGDVDVESVTANGEVSLVIQGAGEVDISGLDCGALSVLIQGAGDVTVSGKCASADLAIQGAGDIDATALDAEDVSTRVQGLGEIKRR